MRLLLSLLITTVAAYEECYCGNSTLNVQLNRQLEEYETEITR